MKNWDSTLPAGSSVNTTEDPSDSGFEDVTVSVPITSPKEFVRLKVTLEE
ncbi:MAG: hypothetical protein ABI162_03730 [Luteolibacter sp.]